MHEYLLRAPLLCLLPQSLPGLLRVRLQQRWVSQRPSCPETAALSAAGTVRPLASAAEVLPLGSRCRHHRWRLRHPYSPRCRGRLDS